MSDHVDRIREQWATERPDVDTAPVDVVGRLHRLATHLTRELVAEYARHGLGEGDFDVLATLRRQGAPYALRPSALAEHTMVTSGGMTKRIDRLEAAGLVARRDADDDGRGRVVALTELGLARIDVAFDAHIANEARLVAALDPADRAALAGLLRTWLERIE